MFRISGTEQKARSHLRAQRLAREAGHTGYIFECAGKAPKWIYLPEHDPTKTTRPVPIELVKESIKALRYVATMEAGQSQKPDLFDPEDTNEWDYADELEKLINS